VRNILIAFAVLALTTVAISQTTPHLGPNFPPHGTVKWAPGMNTNMYILDTLLGGGGALPLTSLNGVQFADQFAGATADVKLNACVTAAISSSSGTCDARGLGGSQTIAAQVNVGNTAQQPVTLLLPSSGTWFVTITDGTSCAIKHFSTAALIGFNGGLGQLVVEPNGASTNLRALYCTDPAPTGLGSYIRAEGFQLYNPVGATLAVAAMDVEWTYDNSNFENITVANYNGVGLYVKGSCCGTLFKKITSNGNGAAGAIPVVVDGGSPIGTVAITFESLSADHAGCGKHEIEVKGGRSTNAINFYNTYVETSSACSGTTHVQITSSQSGVNFYGGQVRVENNSDTAYCFDVTANAGNAIGVFGMSCSSPSPYNAINDHQAGVTVAASADGAGLVPAYATNGFVAGGPFIGPLVKVQRAMVSGAAPTCTFTSGGGTSPSCALDTGSTDTAGIIIATTGTGSPGGLGTITLTFFSTFGTHKPSCIYMANNAGPGIWNGLAVMHDAVPSTTSDLMGWNNGTVPSALSTSTAYWINYHCFAK
jgi:hypothetical protein